MCGITWVQPRRGETARERTEQNGFRRSRCLEKARVPEIKRGDGGIVEAEAQRNGGSVEGSQYPCVGQKLRLVEGPLGGEKERTGRRGAGLVVDHPEIIGAVAEGFRAGAEDAVGAQRAQARAFTRRVPG